MDADRFDALARTLTRPGSRRTLTQILAALTLSGALGSLGIAEVAAKKKKPCPPCKKRKKGKCKGTLPDGTACAGGACQSGSCIAAASPPPPPPPPPDPNACTTSPTACTSATHCGVGAPGSCFCFGAANNAPGLCATTAGAAACLPGGTCANPAQRCISICGTLGCRFPCPTPAP